MDEVRLKRAVTQAARSLARDGVEARAAASTLYCRYSRSGGLRLENRLLGAPDFDHELFLNRFATALVKGSKRSEGPQA